MLIRLFTIFLFLFVYFGSFTLPVFAQSNDDFFKICWTESDCYKDPRASDKDKNTGSKYEFVPGKYLPDGDVCKVKGKENEIGRCYYKPRLIDLQVKIPLIGNVKDVLSDKYFSDNKVKTDKRSGEVSAVAGFPAYIALMYAYFTSIAGIVAVTVMAYGGYQWLVAGGNAEKISQAKSTIQGAVAGLVLVLGSYVILDQINSKLVTMKDLRVDRIKPIFLDITCDKLSDLGIDDLVTEKDKDSDGVSPDNAKCGVKYFSKSNSSQQCMGIYCDDKSGKSYCIPQEKENKWECKSEKDTKYLCEGVPTLAVTAETCSDINKYYNNTNFVCDMVTKTKSETGGGYAGISGGDKNVCKVFDKFICSDKQPECSIGDYNSNCEYREVDKSTSDYCKDNCSASQKCWKFFSKNSS